ncbi:oligoendopeptidase F [Spiroplasma sabaudiense Ar-1343]|uniref:Oligopeptidase F n=1 Tax=Spiroplasma sabaudiense Ar-1343 TaxID=1276257 RepID=W6AIS5_9MOLU|nr:oligoendopeptidase F [Spiroplasma sabaudiense]AHI53609.1 oligoendopeptidase F [Spiroplasma sabaudiense Ar-1343]
MKRTEAKQEYKWDFSHLYKDAGAFKKELKNLEKIISKFEDFQGKLKEETKFFEYLELDTQTDLIFMKLGQYLHLQDIDQTNTELQELEGYMMTFYQKLKIATSFIAPELKEVGEKTIQGWLESNPKYSHHLFGMKKFFEQAKHILPAQDEELLSKVSRSRGAVGSLYDVLAYADRQEQLFTWKGKEQPLTQTLLTEIMEDSDPLKDQQLRREASKLFAKNFIDKKHSFAKIYEGILQASFENVKIRNYPSALEASLSSDAVPKEVYENLIAVGRKFIKPFKDYNLLIKNHYKFKKFYPTDRMLKLAKDHQKNYTVDEAKELIRTALLVLGNDYKEKLEIAWSANRIDYFEDTNKRDGAYSSGGAGVEPIILMNWDDKLSSVATLAHEIGHSVHTLFADESQKYPLSEYPIILAEVASTLNEHLLFEYLYKNATKKEEKIYLLQQRIGDLCGTFFRQIQFAEFELNCHNLVAQGEPITAEVLAQYYKTSEQGFGYEIFDSSDQLPFGWPRISHFFHSPFYVYKYAIDVTASFKLYQDVKDGNIDKVTSFLKAGGHKNPLEILKDVGIDFNEESTYEPLIKAIESMVQDLKDLLQN